jgi:histidinol dehydrogenase
MIPLLSVDELASRRRIAYGANEQMKAVQDVLKDVKQRGDAALFDYTRRFDGIERRSLRVTREELDAACRSIEPELLKAIAQAKANIERFHQRQRRQSWFSMEDDGSILGQVIRPLDRIGVYVPGGRASYPSSVLMNVIPAQTAGVKEIVMVTPPDKTGSPSPLVLATAAELGIQEIYAVGGAQAIAALAFGTEMIRPVDKIVGPGNIYVALAKREVYGHVDIDMIAGPSEIAIVADGTADPDYVAADLLSQAEHDPMASSMLITVSKELAEQVQAAVMKQLERLPRKAIALASLRDHGAVCLVDTVEQAIAAVNRIAPEHLEILLPDPWQYLSSVHHAGAIFLGPYSPEPVGDYFAGPNHVLPTSGTARFASPLNVDDFLKKSSVIFYSKEALHGNGRAIIRFAEAEGLSAHAEAIRQRLSGERGLNDEGS